MRVGHVTTTQHNRGVVHRGWRLATPFAMAGVAAWPPQPLCYLCVICFFSKVHFTPSNYHFDLTCTFKLLLIESRTYKLPKCSELTPFTENTLSLPKKRRQEKKPTSQKRGVGAMPTTLASWKSIASTPAGAVGMAPTPPLLWGCLLCVCH